MFLLSLLDGLQTGMQHGSPGDQGEIIPFLNDAGQPQRKGLHVLRDFFAWATVGASGLEENHRVGVANRRYQQATGQAWRRRNHDFQAWGMDEKALGAFGVLLDGANPPAVRGSHHHRTWVTPTAPTAEARGMALELMEGLVAEAEELNLAHRLQAV